MLLRWFLAALFLFIQPDRLSDMPAAITSTAAIPDAFSASSTLVQLPFSQLVGASIPIGTKGAAPLVVRLDVPTTHLPNLPAAEIRLNRVFAEVWTLEGRWGVMDVAEETGGHCRGAVVQSDVPGLYPPQGCGEARLCTPS